MSETNLPPPDSGATIRWHGVFASPDWEARYRGGQMAEDVRRVRLVMGVVASGFLVYIWNDYHFSGPGEDFDKLLAFRLGVILLSLLSVVKLRQNVTLRAFNLTIMIWSLFSSLALLYVDSTRPEEYAGHTVADVMMVLLTYLALPLPLVWQVTSAGFFSGAILVLGLWLKPWPDEPTALAALTSLLTSNILGAGISSELQLWRRRQFVTLCRERELSTNLEKALHEVKSLRGILPICMHCKKIRDDTGYWQQVEQYVTENTDAQFSHSLCPDCMQSEYPGVDWEALRRKREEKSRSKEY